VQDQTSVPTIPTYIFESGAEFLKAVERGDLVFPLIIKPRSSGKGTGVRLISSVQDLDSVDYSKVLFQPFIQNSGDYRVLMLGGRMLGAMKRIAANGSILNNVSQGGTAVAVKDPILLDRLFAYGVEIALATGLDFFGLDIIEEQQSGNLRFMEVNVAPEWAGFEKVHKVSVADEVLDWLIETP
jgi:glutathione synthase/RimK-type ligase-like ATP-grasp enzyme